MGITCLGFKELSTAAEATSRSRRPSSMRKGVVPWQGTIKGGLQGGNVLGLTGMFLESMSSRLALFCGWDQCCHTALLQLGPPENFL